MEIPFAANRLTPVDQGGRRRTVISWLEPADEECAAAAEGRSRLELRYAALYLTARPVPHDRPPSACGHNPPLLLPPSSTPQTMRLYRDMPCQELPRVGRLEVWAWCLMPTTSHLAGRFLSAAPCRRISAPTVITISYMRRRPGSTPPNAAVALHQHQPERLKRKTKVT